MKYFFPIFFIFIFIYAIIKKVRPYDEFVAGAKGAVPFCINLFPYLLAIFVLTELFSASGLTAVMTKFLSPAFSFFGIPEEINELVLIKPFSGSGSLAVLTGIFKKYGVDSSVARCASAVYGSSETVFYVSSVYFARARTKNLFLPIFISLVSSFLSCVTACMICNIM